jgi:hypothetical protein
MKAAVIHHSVPLVQDTCVLPRGATESVGYRNNTGVSGQASRNGRHTCSVSLRESSATLDDSCGGRWSWRVCPPSRYYGTAGATR